MDAPYLYGDQLNTIWTRFGAGFDYLKSLIKDNNFLNQTSTLSMTDFNSNNGLVPSKRFIFPFADSVPPSPVNSSLRQFISTHQRQIISILSKLLGISVSAITTYFLLKWLMRSLDPTNTDKLAAKSRAEAIMKQLGVIIY